MSGIGQLGSNSAGGTEASSGRFSGFKPTRDRQLSTQAGLPPMLGETVQIVSTRHLARRPIGGIDQRHGDAPGESARRRAILARH